MSKPKRTTFTILAVAIILGFFSNALNAQNSLATSSDSALEELSIEDLDTLSIFQLIDSLLELETVRSSQFSLHLGYTSEVSNAGRTLDIRSYGFNPGISYFHKSGLYADVTGFWNSNLDPKYDLTLVSAGYIGILSPKISFSVSYDHSFYTDTEIDLDYPEWVVDLLLPPILNNSLSTGMVWDLGVVETGFDYSWMFNKESAHRLQGRVNGDFKKYRWLGMDRISLRPAFEVLFGNAEVFNVTFSREALFQKRFPYLIDNSNEFGLMNYRFRMPLSVTKKPFQMIFEYNYNIPVSLPGEDYQYPNNSFFSIDLYYNFSIGSKKSIFE